MEVNNLVKKGKINALCNLHLEDMVSKDNYYVVKYKEYDSDIKVLEYLSEYSEAKILKAFKMVGLDKEVLDVKLNNLSSSEVIRLEFANMLLKKGDMIILFRIDKYLNYKDKLYFKAVLKKISSVYGITIVLLDCGLDFLINLTDRLIVRNDANELIVFNPVNYYDERLEGLIKVPEIVELVKYIKSKGVKISNYTEIAELVKGIYRKVG